MSATRQRRYSDTPATFRHSEDLAPAFTLQTLRDSAQFGDGSISFQSNIGLGNVVWATSPHGLIVPGLYNYIEVAAVIAAGTIEAWLRVNGLIVLHAVFVNPAIFGHYNQFVLSGNGGANDTYHDDIYFGSSSDPANIVNDLQGAVRIYPYIPSANNMPVDWTPLASTNYVEASQIPPTDAAYNSGPTVGLVDQYEMQPISGHGPSGAFSIPFFQAVMSAQLSTAGSALIAPDIAGNVGNSVALTTDFHMYTQSYTDNPVTGSPLTPTDLTTTTFMGPKVTG